MVNENLRKLMMDVIELSRRNVRENKGGPFGALIVRNGEVIARGSNLVTSTNDPTAHAEIVAIREACRVMGTFRLEGCSIVTSCEPCPMCLAAIYWARLEKVYYGNSRKDAAGIGFDDDLIYRELAMPVSQRTLPMIQLLHEEAMVAFNEWLKNPNKTSY